jgi:hypothetical protein
MEADADGGWGCVGDSVPRALRTGVAASGVALRVGAGGLQRAERALGLGALAEGFAVMLEQKEGAGAGVEVRGNL